MTFSDKIKKICRLEGINLKEFSDLSGISYGTLKNYSNPKNQPSLKRIMEISEMPRFKKYKPILLKFSEEDYGRVENPDLEFNALLDRLDEDQLEQLEQYANFLLSQQEKESPK